MAAAYLAPATDRKVLINFYRKVRPFGPGWGPIRQAALAEGPLPDVHDRENVPLALLGWVLGCTMIWSSLFTVGNFLYGRTGYAYSLLVVFAVSATALVALVRRLWK